MRNRAKAVDAETGVLDVHVLVSEQLAVGGDPAENWNVAGCGRGTSRPTIGGVAVHKFDRPLAGQAVEEVLDCAQGLPAHGVPKAGARRDATRPLDVLLEGFQELRFAAGQIRLRARVGGYCAAPTTPGFCIPRRQHRRRTARPVAIRSGGAPSWLPVVAVSMGRPGRRGGTLRACRMVRLTRAQRPPVRSWGVRRCVRETGKGPESGRPRTSVSGQCTCSAHAGSASDARAAGAAPGSA